MGSDQEDRIETLFGSGIDFTKYENWQLTKDYDQASYAERLAYDSVNHEYTSEEEGDDA
tara:strand:- start:13 stop:189 length:177 start_codon:yes stop_codon:yes gene_type:complete